MSTTFALLFACASLTAGDAPPALENPVLRVTCTSDGLLVVQDRRTGREWRQTHIPGSGTALQLSPAATGDRSLVLEGSLPAYRKDWQRDAVPVTIKAVLHPTEPDVTLTFTPHTEAEWRELYYPRVFAVNGADSAVLYPHAEGLLMPVRKDSPDFLELGKDFICSGLGTYCACIGLLDDAGAGMLYVFNDPEFAGYEGVLVESSGVEVMTPQINWRASKFRFDRPWRMTLTFTREGGHAALAREYRRHYAAWGYYKRLEQKARENPTVDRLVGAPVFWIHRTPQDVLDVAEMMKEDGIDRALIEVGFTNYDVVPGGERDNEALEGVVRRIRDMGYVVSRYDQYRDCFERDENESPYHQINTDGYPDGCVRNEDGSLRPAWPPGYVLNPAFGLDLAKKHIPVDLAKRPYNGRFIDCMGTVPTWEGEDWNPHRPLDAYGARKAREDLLDYVNGLGLVVGTEGGIDFFLSRLHWLETPMSLVRWTAPGMSVPGWQPVPDFPEYRVSIGTRYRIPFYSLVHHDEVMITWRWEDGFVRTPQYLRQKVLWSLLYGNPPMYFLDRDTYLKHRNEIAETCREVCSWTRTVGYARMVGHRFLTADRHVQETTFSSGHRIVVNFGTNEYRDTGRVAVAPQGYHIEAKAAVRDGDSG